MSAYEWLIGTRYLRSTHRRGFVSFVALISVCGLTLGVATLIVVLSVMNGFERELRSRILAVTSHATLMGLSGALPDWRALQQQIRRQSGVEAAVPYVESLCVLANGRRLAAAKVRGVLPEEERSATGLAQRVISGSLDDLRDGSYAAILGSALAHELDARVGDTVVLIAPQGTATPTGVVPRMRRFRVVGLIHSGMYEFDRGLALTHMADAARLFQVGAGVTGLRLALTDPLKAPATVRRVALALGGPGFYVTDWTQDHANFFRSIEITKSMMFVILLMIVAVAAFNIVATLVMIVKEKQTDIAILRTFGAGPRNVLLTFAVQGVLIGLAGTVLGAGLGTLLADNLESLVGALERLLGTQFLDARVYYMSDLPAYVEAVDVLKVCGVAFALCALATVYPAWRAARTAPAQALRHE
ncbi:MAG: lipoprotein-releasing ABC transporter permease subunit [Gammaproteobacteria bacterium]|nr:MAG: lipoprotein-releasing ABC transporter permease subunit [Gammaproteobacteria bacterium]TLY67321.1 MAG: lipoprotein-releasing ABC transporter permease subunit [Gammaproteobacteria bacterium]TLZ00842.1 MAG: lipoprotein-releasing ABC transporter permease subunit [Gammaproteobacteria bacterium]